MRSTVILFFCSLAGITSAAAQSVVIEWNQALLDAVQATRTPPPIASRAFAIVHTAMFDAWAAFDEKATGVRSGSRLRRPAAERTDANRQAALSHAAYAAAVDLFASQRARFDRVLAGKGDDPAGVGKAAAEAVLAHRHADGSNQLGDLATGAYADYTNYRPVNSADAVRDPFRWQPLANPDGTVQQFLLPHWGRVVPFGLTSGSEFRPGRPPFFSNIRYQSRCEEVVHLSAALTDRDKVIAEYWEDGAGTVTPPGHWQQIAQEVSKRNGQTLEQDVKLFFALANAQFDAGIAAWDAKRQYDYIRPISAVRIMNEGKLIEAWGGPGRGTRRIRGEDWLPYLNTPPFAEYVSGHSTFSGASAEVLAMFTGSDDYGASVTFAAGSSRIEPGVTPAQEITLKWDTFSEAADEAGLSRRLGGIHFEDGDLRGRTLGRMIGRRAWEKASGYWNGAQ